MSGKPGRWSNINDAIHDGDSQVLVEDSGTGQITMTVDDTTVQTWIAAGTSFPVGTLYVGTDDTIAGTVVVYGHAAGSTAGGTLRLHTAADHDTTINTYTMEVVEDDFYLKDNVSDIMKVYGGSTIVFTRKLYLDGVDFETNGSYLGQIDMPGGLIELGEDGVRKGELKIYGNATGSVLGGQINLYIADDHDATITHYGVEVTSDDLQIGPNTAPTALQFGGGGDQWTFNKGVYFNGQTLNMTGGTLELSVGGWTIGNNTLEVSANDLNTLYNVTPGTVAANKAVVVDASKDIASVNLISGDAAPTLAAHLTRKDYVDDIHVTLMTSGWEDASQVAIASDGATPPTITLTFTGTVYFWSNGIRYSKTGTDALQIADTNGDHWFYYEGDTLTIAVNPSHTAADTLIKSKCLVAMLHWNTNTNVTPILARETHGIQMSGATHEWIHDNIGAKMRSGGAISGYTLATASDAAISFDLTDMEFYDDDIEHEVEDGSAAVQYEQVLTGDAEIPVLYRDNVTGHWIEQAASTLPYLVGGSTRIQYMVDDLDGTWSLAEVANNGYCNYWLVLTNDWQYPVKMIPGTQTYSTPAAAAASAGDELAEFGDLPSAEYIIMYRFLMKDGAGGTTNATIVDVTDYRFSGITGANAQTANDHGALSGLADDDHTQYQLLAGRDAQRWTLNPALGTDLTATGKILTDATVDANATGIGAALYLAADFHYDEADASAAATMRCTAMALETGTGSKDVLLEGFIRNDAWDWSAGDIYVSLTTGGLTQTAPSASGEQVQVVGWAYSADIMYFKPSSTVLEIA